MAKKAKCYKCKKTVNLQLPIERDLEDRLDIFKCMKCGINFKLNVKQYLKNLDKKNFVVSTFSSKKRVFAKSLPEDDWVSQQETGGQRFFAKYWWAIMIIIAILVLWDDMKHGRI